jgi:enamine deaminase RidA (YjgF/YER057c/UK114 family)
VLWLGGSGRSSGSPVRSSGGLRGRPAPGGHTNLEERAAQVFDSIGSVHHAAGGTLADVMMLRFYTVDRAARGSLSAPAGRCRREHAFGYRRQGPL